MKKVVIVLSSLVVTALMICTILSVQIERLMSPEIDVVRATKAGILDAVSGEEIMYDYTLPLSALMHDNLGDYVLMLERIDGVWGNEQIVSRYPITDYDAMDESCFASERLAYIPDGFAIYPSQDLKGGEKVRVRGK